ncbi:glycosyltransferase family 4 protein [Caldivirga maquilingensis]|uniref:Glycosyl transferase group 1 n=1 Tax=Caldivirga maquilingensis (strain ATCC 700844 / DSM 13496 / JCM 10307 / IC-167) TaxID=397948 RepID=A8M953_CALMQ|nr:glycosyltransferase family 4 protein [Caldivirga maquilingensis]ABW02272.1 glycosyl transferase group 1 [Caldivirga maquilingensis IC-167]
MLKIALALGYYEIGGFKTVIDNLAAKLSEKGHEVTVYARVIRTKPPKDVNVIKASPQEFYRETRKHDIIHVHTSYPYLKVLADNNALDNVVFTYHGYAPWYEVPGTTSKLINLYLLIMYKRLLKKVKVVTAVSNYVKEQVRKLFNREAIVIYNGVNLTVFKPNMNINKQTNEIIIFNATAWNRFKGQERLIKYYRVIKRQYPNAKLMMRGNYQGNSEDIQVLPPMDPTELAKYYSMATFYLLVSSWESFGLPIIESMACGTPVIAWDRPDARREHILNSGAGYLFRNEEELLQAVKNVIENREELSQKAINYARQFDWENIVNKYLDAYGVIINEEIQ